MDFKLFDEFITLQSLLKDQGIVHSGGAVKQFLAQTPVYFNGELENRRGKKLRVGDKIDIPSLSLEFSFTAPSQAELTEYQEEKAEKERVAKLVKEMNKGIKKKQNQPLKKPEKAKKPVRFPGR